jgi:hypothetical protein
MWTQRNTKNVTCQYNWQLPSHYAQRNKTNNRTYRQYACRLLSEALSMPSHRLTKRIRPQEKFSEVGIANGTIKKIPLELDVCKSLNFDDAPVLKRVLDHDTVSSTNCDPVLHVIHKLSQRIISMRSISVSNTRTQFQSRESNSHKRLTFGPIKRQICLATGCQKVP